MSAAGGRRIVVPLAREVWRVLRRLSPRELATTARAAIVLIVVEASIRWVSVPRLSRTLGVRLNLAPPGPVAQLAVEDLPESARRALYATRRVTRFWPFCEGPCLRRALVGGHLIRDLDPAIRIGIGGTVDSLRAHAWLEVGDRPLEDLDDLQPFQRAASGRALA